MNVVARLQIRVKQLLPGPKRAFGHRLIFIGCKLFEQRKKLPVGAIAHGDGNVPPQTSTLCPADGRSAKYFAELFRAHFSKPIKRRIDQLGSRLELRRSGCRSLTVPGADILADVASKNILADACPQLLGNRSPLLDREIGNALGGIEFIGTDKSVGRTSLDTAGAAPTAVGSRQIRCKFERRQDHAQEKPRTLSLIDDASIFADPPHAGVLRVDTLNNRPGVDVGAGYDIKSFASISGCA